ncbi:hypothetical protein BHM03_00034104 [Ensete ventricosum]|nr:hypothetical protein BHM03_00034104 [Ensete ventricosum]
MCLRWAPSCSYSRIDTAGAKIPPVVNTPSPALKWHCHCHGNGSEQHSGGKLRWRKRIGHLLQLARWKRSNKASTSHVGFGCKVDGVLGNQQEFR